MPTPAWKSWLHRATQTAVKGWLTAAARFNAAKQSAWGKRLASLWPSRRPPHKGCRLPPNLTSHRLGRAQARQLAHCLEDQKKLLLVFSDRLEAEFLKLGAALQAMDQEAVFIEQKYHRIFALTSGQAEDSPLRQSSQLLQQAEQFVAEGYQQYERVFQVFRDLTAKMNSAIHQQNQLQRALSLLPPIVVQFRVQASEFAEEVRQPYYALADEMDVLLDQIRSAVDQQFIGLWRSRGACGSLGEDLAANIARYRIEIQKTLDISRGHLRSLSEAMNEACLAVRDVTQGDRGISAEINRVIMALQCQDITRQKIQHVTQAADEISAHLNQAQNRRLTPAEASDLRQFAGEAAGIQSRQIKAVCEDNERAAAQITDGMRGLQHAAGKLAEGAVRTAQLALDSGIIQQSIESLRDMMMMMKVTGRKTEEIRAAIAPLEITFEATTAKISSLAQGVRRSALNAQIQAARVEGGAVLEVLAEQTRKVSDQTLRTAEQLAIRIDEMSALIRQLQRELASFQETADERQHSLAQAAKPCETNLHALQMELPELISPIAAKQKRLAEAIENAMRENRFPAAVAETRSAALPFWEALSAWVAHAGGSGTNSEEVARQLDRLKDNYTMDHERNIHNSASTVATAAAPGIVAAAAIAEITGSTPLEASPSQSLPQQAPLAPAGVALESSNPTPADSAPAPAEPPAEEKKKDDLGDNIELF